MENNRNSRYMTVRSGNNKRADDRLSSTDISALLTVAQTVICVLAVTAIFTLQFINEETYEAVGVYYNGAMTGEGFGEAVFVGQIAEGIISSPEVQSLLDELGVDSQSINFASMANTASSLAFISTAGMGGEEMHIPDNLTLGRVVLSAKAIYPLEGEVTSHFGPRIHPISGNLDFHTGVDIAAPQGDYISAVLPGEVEEIGYSDIYGNYIEISHGERISTTYSHCEEITRVVGEVVRVGEKIAKVGSTGVSTGSHLHFEVLVDGNYIDPMNLYY